MSWSFNHTGTRAGVREKIIAESYVPSSVKHAICDVIGAPFKGTTNGVNVTSHGHVDEHSATLKLEITPVQIVLDPAPPAAVEPPV